MRRSFWLILALLALAGCAGEGAKAQTNGSVLQDPRSPAAIAAGTQVEISGVVRRVGSQLFNHLVLTDQYGNEWHLADPTLDTRADLEQQSLRLVGTVAVRELVLADGRRLGTQYELNNIIIK